MALVGILGHGVVGQGVAEILVDSKALIKSQSGIDITLARVCDSRIFTNTGYDGLFTDDFDSFLCTPGMEIVVECIGGVDHSYRFIKRALSAGKHAVTSNKELVVKHGEELEELARQNRVGFYYEASTGGGIPVIATLMNRLPGDRIQRLHGILNGTTNYILTRMSDGDSDYQTALSEAQKLGYAESDPSADVLGWDTRRKLNILSHVCFGAKLDDTNILTTGITKITREAMAYALHMGRSIKLIASAINLGDSWTGYVAPVMLPTSHILSSVSDVFNAVMVCGDRVGDMMMYGRGAGRYPTASAVVADIVEAARRISNPDPITDKPAILYKTTDISARYFIRLHNNGEDILQYALKQFPGARIVNIDTHAYNGECALVTEEAPVSELNNHVESLKKVALIDEPILYQTM